MPQVKRVVAGSGYSHGRWLSLSWAVLAGAGWAWAYALLAIRQHSIEFSRVMTPAPIGWGFLALPIWHLLLAVGLGAGWTWLGLRRSRWEGRICPRPVAWLLSAYTIPLLEVLRSQSGEFTASFFEALGFVVATSLAAADFAAGESELPRLADRLDRWAWLGLVWLASLAAGVWWYFQSLAAYEDYLLGYHDFGHFALRVANTWEGRGWLLETPSLPAFWDHFNPGLASLAPLWGLWPDARLFMALQAGCLALPAPLVFGIARRWDARPLAAAAWAGAYLVFPSVGQLNLNYSYGWHPVSQALPLLFLAVWLLLRGHRTAAAVAVVWACSFEETIVAAVACGTFALGLQAWWFRSRLARVRLLPADAQSSGAERETAETAGEFMLALQLPTGVWWAAWACLTVAFVLAFKLAPFAQFQTGRFSNLGDSAVEIILSPLRRPGAFWGQVVRPMSLLFVLSLTAPLGIRSVFRGWSMLLAAAVPVGVLLAWQRGAATSVAFQYTTSLIPVLMLAALAGSVRELRRTPPAITGPNASSASPLLVAGIVALVSGFVASTFLGALPWSSPTLVTMEARTYLSEYQTTDGGDKLAPKGSPRGPGTAAHEALEQVIREVRSSRGSVLASGRIAAHLLGMWRLESVEQAVDRWPALSREAGVGRTGVEVFDWVMLDTLEEFQQSREKLQFCRDEAQRAGYQTLLDRHGILVFKRPNG